MFLKKILKNPRIGQFRKKNETKTKNNEFRNKSFGKTRKWGKNAQKELF